MGQVWNVMKCVLGYKMKTQDMCSIEPGSPHIPLFVHMLHSRLL